MSDPDAAKAAIVKCLAEARKHAEGLQADIDTFEQQLVDRRRRKAKLEEDIKDYLRAIELLS